METSNPKVWTTRGPIEGHLNTLADLVPYKERFVRQINNIAEQLVQNPLKGWSKEELVTNCVNAGEGFDIDLFVPAMKAAGFPDSHEYDSYVPALGPNGHRICYNWAAETLFELWSIIVQPSGWEL